MTSPLPEPNMIFLFHFERNETKHPHLSPSEAKQSPLTHLLVAPVFLQQHPPASTHPWSRQNFPPEQHLKPQEPLSAPNQLSPGYPF